MFLLTEACVGNTLKQGKIADLYSWFIIKQMLTVTVQYSAYLNCSS